MTGKIKLVAILCGLLATLFVPGSKAKFTLKDMVFKGKPAL